MKILDRFRSGELERIRDAVERAELRTSGEIVTYIVGECDVYPEAGWRGATLGAVGGLGAGFALHQFSQMWWSPFWWSALPSLIGAAGGLLLSSKVARIRRWLVRKDLLAHRVGMRAEAAFLEEEVFDTRERTGILLFVALFERRVVVLGDSGINAAVEQSEWDEVVQRMLRELRQGRAVEAILGGVEDCGRLLEHRGVEIRPDDTDELDNMPRLRDR